MGVFDDFIGSQRPLSWVIRFWPVLVAAWVCALAGTWVCKRVALRFGIVDRPDHLVKTHKEPVAYLGGVGMLIGFAVGMVLGLYLIRDEVGFATAWRWLAAILAGSIIACGVGVLDDLLDIRPSRKMLGQALAALALIVGGVLPSLNRFVTPFGWTLPAGLETALGVIVVAVFVLGATNSLNLLDGLDGLCAGVTGIMTLALLALAVHLGTWGYSPHGDSVRMIVCLALVGGVFGFLPFNRHPAKIFMGDAGSMLLGFVVASLMILFGEQVPRWWMASGVVFGLPILDTATALVRRLINGRPLFVSDRGHIYDQMIDRGIPLRRTVQISYGLAALYAVIGLVMSQIRTRYAVVVYVLVFAVSGVIVWRKGYLRMEGLRGATREKGHETTGPGSPAVTTDDIRSS